MPAVFTASEILNNIHQTVNEGYTVRRIGSSSTVILTFAGPKVPYTVRLYGAEYPCSIYKKTIPLCGTCHMVGHRATACPNTAISVVYVCGLQNLYPEHSCNPTCGLFGGPRPQAAINGMPNSSSCDSEYSVRHELNHSGLHGTCRYQAAVYEIAHLRLQTKNGTAPEASLGEPQAPLHHLLGIN